MNDKLAVNQKLEAKAAYNCEFLIWNLDFSVGSLAL
jgi:hypothetical protein